VQRLNGYLVETRQIAGANVILATHS
jgi:hypothetical protein